MKQLLFLLATLLVIDYANAQTVQTPILYNDRVQDSMVDFDAYEKLLKEVKKHRKTHLVPLDKFLQMSNEPNVIILDTRSDSMYNAKHVKGAIHLNFSDFTQDRLAQLIPDKNTKILIYCNNNFTDDPISFATKSVRPTNLGRLYDPGLTLALNIPTYINLFGYGYKNVYELSQAISVNHSKISFEGTSIGTLAIK